MDYKPEEDKREDSTAPAYGGPTPTQAQPMEGESAIEPEVIQPEVIETESILEITAEPIISASEAQGAQPTPYDVPPSAPAPFDAPFAQPGPFDAQPAPGPYGAPPQPAPYNVQPNPPVPPAPPAYPQAPPPGAYGQPPQQPYMPPPAGNYPPPAGPQQPYGNYPPAPEPSKGKAVASLVLGIISLIVAWFGYGALLAIVLSVVGIILGVQARKEMPAGSTGMATAGMVMSIIALALSLVVFVTCALCASLISSSAYYW